MDARKPTFTEFWTESLAKDLFRFLKYRLKCTETAEELTHETYLRLHKKINEAPLDNARAFAFHIAQNLAIDYQRKLLVRSRYIEQTLDHQQYAHSPLPVSVAERTLMAEERLHLLRNAMDDLPENCRTAFILHSVHGLTYLQIAERMGISRSMVNKLLAKAMLHCKQALDND